MTTNQVQITEGSGKSIATDTVSSVDYQRIKVTDGTAGSTNALKVNADGSMQVSVAGTINSNLVGTPSISGVVKIEGNVGASVIGVVPVSQTVTPWVVNVPTPSYISYQLAGSVLATSSGNSSVQLLAGVAIIGSVATLQGTNPWVIGNSSVQLVGGTAVIGAVSSTVGAVTPYAQPNAYVAQTTSIITVTTAISVLGAPGSNLRNYITNILVTNGSATATYVTIKDSGASVLASGYAAASGGGFSSSFPTPLRQWTSNASVDLVSSAQASVVATVSGFVGA